MLGVVPSDLSGVGCGPFRKTCLQPVELFKHLRRALRIEPIPRKKQTLFYMWCIYVCVKSRNSKFTEQVVAPPSSYPEGDGYPQRWEPEPSRKKARLLQKKLRLQTARYY